jgi:hypothetical protein
VDKNAGIFVVTAGSTVKLVQGGIATTYRIYFPHWSSFRIIQDLKKFKSIKIIFHGTYLSMSENRRRWFW